MHTKRAPIQGNDEWLWGWDPTPGIVSVWAEPNGQAIVWRRPDGGAVVREDVRFRPWLLLASLNDLEASGAAFVRLGDQASDQPTTNGGPALRVRELNGPGALRYRLSGDCWSTIERALCCGASKRLGRRISRLHELDRADRFVLPPDEQYLVGSGRSYFRGLSFAQLHRLQFDLETTGLDPSHNRVFLIAVRAPDGTLHLLEARDESRAAEAELLRVFMGVVQQFDPDVLENHNLHGFDLPFLHVRAQQLGVRLVLGRLPDVVLQERAAMRGARSARDPERRVRFVAPGRECIDTLDAVRRYDFSSRELPSHGLKVVARHFGLAGPDREQIRGDRIHAVYGTDPDRVRRYAAADVHEVEGLARLLGGAAFALARMTPRRYERVADAGPATGVIDPLLARAYLRAGEALPAFQQGDGTVHSGAALMLFTAGAAHRVVKVDVASLYPSLMRAFYIGPSRDHLGALLFFVDRLVMQRLEAKQAAKRAAAGTDARHENEALSAAMKLVVNSAYGYLAAGEGLTRFADVHAANEVTRRGRDTLMQMCRALAARGVLLLEADTDGVYFAVPEAWQEADERRVVQEVAALLPPLVQLEFEGRYAAMLSHEPKNYALLSYHGQLQLKGVAFRSSRAEPFGEQFLRVAIARLLAGDVRGVRQAYLDTVRAVHRRDMPTVAMCSRVRLRKAPATYLRTREQRREFAYEAMLHSGRTSWSIGDQVRVYRTVGGGAMIEELDGEALVHHDARNYDASYYIALLRRTFATRLARALSAEDFALVFADVDQLPLFAASLDAVRVIATPAPEAWAMLTEG